MTGRRVSADDAEPTNPLGWHGGDFAGTYPED